MRSDPATLSLPVTRLSISALLTISYFGYKLLEVNKSHGLVVRFDFWMDNKEIKEQNKILQ